MSGAELIAAERLTNTSWAAITYAGHALEIVSDHELPDADTDGYWPWDEEWYKPSPNPVRNLVKAGALLAAEIDRLQRDEAKP